MTFPNQHREFLRGSCTTGRTTSLTLVGIDWLKFKNPEDRRSEGSRECPLSWDLNVGERVSVADRAAPWVFIFSPGNTEGGCDHADHTERATNGCYAEEGDEAEQG